MTGILTRVASGMRSQFRPSSPQEYLALRLACRLGEPEAAAHYATLAAQHPVCGLMSAYRAAVAAVGRGELPARTFHEALSADVNHGFDSTPRHRLLAVRIERRAVAAAVFCGTHLEGRRVRQLSSSASRAEASTAGFIRSMLSENDCQSVAIEAVPRDTLRALLHDAALLQCRATDVSVWEVSRASVLAALGHPPLGSRGEVRDLVLRLWPMPELRRSQLCALDAFAVGLYVQTERLFADDS